jgi:hypothetical protein
MRYARIASRLHGTALAILILCAPMAAVAAEGDSGAINVITKFLLILTLTGSSGVAVTAVHTESTATLCDALGKQWVMQQQRFDTHFWQQPIRATYICAVE